MLKILLVVGGVWISFAFLFVLALAAAGAKSIPPEMVEAPDPSVSPDPQLAESTSPSRPARRKMRWRISKAMRA